MTTNIQSFAGDVQIDSGNLSVKSLEVKDGVTKLGSNNTTYSNVGVMMTRKDGASNVAFLFTEDGANVVLGYTNDDALEGDRIDILTDEKANLVVYGNVYVTGSVHGDGSTLTGLVTTLQSVSEFGAETDQTILFTNEITGINVSSNVLVSGNVTANVYYGDGGLLANITQTLEGITAIGNTTPYTLEFNNTHTSFVTVSNVGIGNALPTADLCVGSNVVLDDERLNKINVVWNVACHQLNLGSVEILPAYSLENVTQISNTTTNTLSFNNSTLAFDTQKMAGIGIIPSSADVGVSGLHVDGHLRLGGEAENTDEEQMYIKAAGALGVLANESDTNNTNTELRLQSGDTNNSNITMVGKSSAQYMTFGTNAAERMRINSSGNVGIGTNSPAYKLDVRGTASHAGSELMARWNSQNETVFPQDITAQYHKIATLGTTGDGSNGGKLRISGTIGGFGESSTTLIDAFVSTRGGPSYGGTLHGYGGGDDPIDKVDILVYKEADDTFAVWIKLVRFFTFDFTVTGGTITGASRTLVLLPCPVTDTSVATPTGTLEGSVVSACSIVFTAGGNLGIGTTNPTSNLHVVGDAYVNSNLTVGTANLHVDTTTGFVGVGTNNPVGVNGGNRLEGSSATGFEFISSRADNTTEIDDFIGAYLFKNTDTDGNAPHYCGMSAKGATTNGAMSLYFHSQRDKYELGNTPDLFIDTNGRVGVGTDDPDYTLDVVGTGGFSSNLTVGTANLHVDTTTGFVGVGTTNPLSTVDISSTTGLILRNTANKTAVD